MAFPRDKVELHAIRPSENSYDKSYHTQNYFAGPKSVGCFREICMEVHQEELSTFHAREASVPGS